MTGIVFVLTLLSFFSCEDKQGCGVQPMQQVKMPGKKKVWVFIMAGQSNMAGRAFVEPQDTLTSSRIISIDKDCELILAKEPLHFYEPSKNGLDCGLSFGKTLLKSIPDSITLLLLPTAVGGSSIDDWIGDADLFGVKLLSNFREKAGIGMQYGEIRGILWHQGESDANTYDIKRYKANLTTLFTKFRNITGNDTLPVLIGELGSYSGNDHNWQAINQEIQKYAFLDTNTAVISTTDLEDIGDRLHFNSKSQRVLGQRFAESYLQFIH
jgi:hypothetical protein